MVKGAIKGLFGRKGCKGKGKGGGWHGGGWDGGKGRAAHGFTCATAESQEEAHYEASPMDVEGPQLQESKESASLVFPVVVEDGRQLTIGWTRGDDLRTVAE